MVFTLEQDAFIVKAYFRSGTMTRGRILHSSALVSLLMPFLKKQFIMGMSFAHHQRNIVRCFRQTGSVYKGKSTGRPILTEDGVFAWSKALINLFESYLNKKVYHMAAAGLH